MLDSLDHFDASETDRSRVVGAFHTSRPRGDRARRSQVDHWEAAVEADPEGSLVLDEEGMASLGGLAAGRFETLSLAELRRRAGRSATGSVRLWVLDGANPLTDIGALQAQAPPGSLFQVASQFNCLEAPGPWIVRVADYFSDPTQGPRASISAYPGTLLRHYRAPGRDGQRFVQRTGGPQLNLLHAVEAPVQSGYLVGHDIARPAELLARLENDFELLEVGLHQGLEVVLGADWDGPVQRDVRIAQVFTSTLAAGGYGRLGDDLLPVCRQLLRAAYLGTLLAAAGLDQRRVILTLIGGGVFGNPLPLIWESILWAIDQVTPHLRGDLTVIVNGRTLIPHVSAEEARAQARARGGELLLCYPSGVRF